MNTAFPFGFPLPTALYLTLYVLTLVVHVVFMNYVLAGTGYLAISAIGRGGRTTTPSPIRDLLVDWMPFVLGATITAGVAPLLFVQILYKQNFYTANLLLFNRWMAILPVLIVGFYMLYLLKSAAVRRRPGWRFAIAVAAFLCIAFVGYSWTENHLLSVDRAKWTAMYTTRETIYWSPQLLPRLGLWAFGGLPTMALLVLWQLRGAEHDGRYDTQIVRRAVRRLAVLALAGLVLAGICGGIYYAVGGSATHDGLLGPLGRVYAIIAAAGLLVQAIVWITLFGGGKTSRGPLILGTIVVPLTILALAVIRESLRLQSLDITAYYAQHEDAATKGGLIVFLVFAVLNIGLITWCVRLVRGRHAATPLPKGAH